MHPPDQEWKHSCYRECLAPVLDVISQPSLQYEVVIELDKKIRDFSIPDPLRNGAPQSRSLIMQKASLSTALEAGAFIPPLQSHGLMDLWQFCSSCTAPSLLVPSAGLKKHLIDGTNMPHQW